MSLFPVVQRLLDKAGAVFIEPRREDGHGSSAGTPSYVQAALDAATLAALENTAVTVSNFPDTQKIADSTDIEWVPVATSVTAAGNTTIYTPAAGKRIRLHWIYAINNPVASTSTKISVIIGSVTYYVAWAISKRQQFTGAVNAPLIINLTNPGDVAVTAFIEEI